MESTGEALITIGGPGGWGPELLTEAELAATLKRVETVMGAAFADMTILRQRKVPSNSEAAGKPQLNRTVAQHGSSFVVWLGMTPHFAVLLGRTAHHAHEQPCQSCFTALPSNSPVCMPLLPRCTWGLNNIVICRQSTYASPKGVVLGAANLAYTERLALSRLQCRKHQHVTYLMSRLQGTRH